SNASWNGSIHTWESSEKSLPRRKPPARLATRNERLKMEEQLTETWSINNRINLYLLDGIKDEALGDVSASKGRSVAEAFAHLHNVRLMWLKPASPELLEGLEKIEKEEALNRKLLKSSLEVSGKAIGILLKKSLAAGGKVKGFKPHAVA